MSHVLDNIVCLDFEASELGLGSFPIEVAVAEAKTGAISSWLIRPTDYWLRTGYGPKSRPPFHKITRGEIVRDGLPIIEVASELSARCEGKRVLSDAPEFDGAWLARLYERRPVSFRLLS